MSDTLCLYGICTNIWSYLRRRELIIGPLNQLNGLAGCIVGHLDLWCDLISIIDILKACLRMVRINVCNGYGRLIIQNNHGHIVALGNGSIVVANTCISYNNAIFRSHTTGLGRIGDGVIGIFFQICFLAVCIRVGQFRYRFDAVAICISAPIWYIVVPGRCRF